MLLTISHWTSSLVFFIQIVFLSLQIDWTNILPVSKFCSFNVSFSKTFRVNTIYTFKLLLNNNKKQSKVQKTDNIDLDK